MPAPQTPEVIARSLRGFLRGGVEEALRQAREAGLSERALLSRVAADLEALARSVRERLAAVEATEEQAIVALSRVAPGVPKL